MASKGMKLDLIHLKKKNAAHNISQIYLKD